jgi:hypothetical protein
LSDSRWPKSILALHLFLHGGCYVTAISWRSHCAPGDRIGQSINSSINPSIDSIRYTYWVAGRLHQLVTADMIPPSFPLQLNTASLSPLAPGLAAKYPTSVPVRCGAAGGGDCGGGSGGGDCGGRRRRWWWFATVMGGGGGGGGGGGAAVGRCGCGLRWVQCPNVAGLCHRLVCTHALVLRTQVQLYYVADPATKPLVGVHPSGLAVSLPSLLSFQPVPVPGQPAVDGFTLSCPVQASATLSVSGSTVEGNLNSANCTLTQ